MRLLPVLLVALLGGASCTLFIAGSVTPCDDDDGCPSGDTCVSGFCDGKGAGVDGGEGEKGEGEGEGDEGEGDEGEGEGDEGEGEGDEGEGEGDVGGEGEGDVGGEGEGEGDVFFEFCGDVPPPAWADPAFNFRVPLSFCDRGAPNADVVDLAVLVKVTDAAILGDIQQQGKDVRFFDQRIVGGAPIPLSHERVVFTAASATFWVKMPRMNPSTERDHIWMYFGSANAADTSTGANTFTNYNGVFHMENNAGTEAKTGVNTDVIGVLPGSGGADVSAGPALVDNGVDMDGNNKFMVLDDDGVLNNNTNFGIGTQAGSVSLVVGRRPNGTAMGDGMVFFYADGQGDCNQGTCSFGFDQRSLHLTVGQTAGSGDASIGVSMPTNPARPAAPTFVVAGGGVLNRAGFSHVLVTWNAANVKIFVNGAFIIEQNNAGIIPFQARFIDIGTSQQLGNVFTGSVDELRISNNVRDNAYARAEARSTLGQLITTGPIEAR